MPRGSSPKCERQYEHIKESALGRGESEKRAKRSQPGRSTRNAPGTAWPHSHASAS